MQENNESTLDRLVNRGRPPKPFNIYEGLLWVVFNIVMIVFLQTCSQIFLISSLGLATIALIVMLFRLLFPPRYSTMRAVFIFECLLSYVLIFSYIFEHQRVCW